MRQLVRRGAAAAIALLLRHSFTLAAIKRSAAIEEIALTHRGRSNGEAAIGALHKNLPIPPSLILFISLPHQTMPVRTAQVDCIKLFPSLLS